MLRREGVIDEALIKKLLGRRHSGFSIHHQVRIGSQDQPGREKLAQYILRAALSQQKMRYHAGECSEGFCVFTREGEKPE